MKKITLLILTLFISFVGYAQFPTPGTEGFEGTTGADLAAPTTPTPWTLGTGVTGNQWAVFDNGVGLGQRWGINNAIATPPLVYAGTNAAYINRENIGLGNTSEDYLATPILTVPTNGQLRFFARTFSNGNTGTLYQVKIASAPGVQNSPASYTTLLAEYTEDQLTVDPDGVQNAFNVYTEKVIDFPATFPAGSQVYVAFVMKYTQTTTTISGDRWLLDNVRVTERCLDPTTLTATGIVYNGATLNWANPSGATSWEIEIVPVAAAPTGTGTVYSGTLPYVATGLTPNTCYKYYVRALCGDGINSEWVGPIQFCTPIAPPICGGNYLDAGLATGNYSNNTDSTITICPVTPGDVVTVTFTSFNTEANADGMYVFNGNSITAPQMASTNPAGTVPGGLAGSYWGTTIPGPFTSSSPNGCLTFRFRSGAATVASGWAANITCGPPPPCSEPISVTRTAITATSVTLGWTNTNAATEWHCLALPCGSPAPTASATGWVTATTNPFVLNTLNPDTCYDFYVRAACNTTDFSDWTSPVSATTQMIPPTCGGTFSDPGGSSGNYANNTNSIVTICPTVVGEVVTVTFTSFNTQATADGLYIFNGNSITAPLMSSGNPAGTVPGGVAGAYWGTANPGSFTSTSADGCLTFRFRSGAATNAAGWTSNVTCAPPPTCPKPQSLLTSSVTHNSVNLAWTENGTATAWQVLALPCGSPFPSAGATGWVSASTNNAFVLGGLSSETCYDIYVRSECSASDLSTWAGPKTITTIIAPPVCGGVFVDPGGASGNYGNNANVTWTICPTITGEQVTVTFTSFATENNFDFLRVYDGTTAAATLIGTYTGATLPPQIEASSASGCLTFVFTSDGSAVSSGWVANVTCAPPPTCPKPINLVATGLTASSVNLTWTENGTATSWEVIIQPAGSGMPSATAVGTIVTTTSYTATGLTAGINYEFWVRAICSSTDISNWNGPRTFVLVTSCGDSISFCGDEGGENYNGTTGIPSLGSPGCLGSTPNPAWYNFQVDQSGSITFQISQTNSVTGAPIDVDFILWGPLTGPTCTALYDYPDGNTSFPTNIVDCSYSTAAVESADIPNAIVGQYYTLLITNFSNQPSNIVFDITPASTGSASCPCTIELGPDVTVCGTSYTINATSTNSTSFAWYNGTDLIPGATTSSLTVTSSGTYKCIIQCGTLLPVEDTIVVTLNTPIVPTFDPIPSVCQNTTAPTLPLTSLNGISGTWLPSTIDTATAGSVTHEFTPDVIPTQTCVETTSVTVTVIGTPVPDAPTNVVACDSYTLPALTTGNYYTATNGGGTMLNAGHTILLPGTTTLYVYAASGTTPNCTAENSFTVTINTIDAQVVSNVTACDSYTLPALNANNSYYTATNGGGTMLNAGDVITTTQTIYVWAQSGTTPNCTDESSFTVTINTTPTVAPISNVSACDSYTLPALAVGNYYTASNGGGTMLAAGSSITSTQTLYVYASTGTTPNCSDEESFTVTINSINAQTLSNVTVCDSYTLPVLNANNSYYTATNGGGTMLAAGSPITTSQTIYIWAQTGTTPNCTDESSFTVTINTTPTLGTFADVTACDSYTLPALSLGNYYTAAGGTGTMLTAGSSISTSQMLYVYASTGTTPNCSDEESFTVTIAPSPQFTIEGGCDGGVYILEVIPTNFDITAASYQWTDSNSVVVGTNISTLQVTNADNYSCQVTLNTCPSAEGFAATDIGCMIPKGISPNNDTKNDTFDLSGFNVKELSIYNRYGTKVYSKKSYTNQWAGQSDNGDELPDGTYYYVIERDGVATKSGWVYINREVK